MPTASARPCPALPWKLVKIERNYQWYRSGNSWNYEPVTFTEPVANGTIDIAADGEATISLPVDWGRYRLEVETADAGRPGHQRTSSTPAGMSRRPRPRRLTASKSRSTRRAMRPARRPSSRSRRASPASCWSPSAPRSCSTTVDGQRARGRRDHRHPGRRRLGRRRLCHGHAVPARRGAGNRACRCAPSA